MKKSVFTAILTAVATLILVACEKSGYIGPEQEGVVAKLTANNWVCKSITYPDSSPEIYDEDNMIYSFETSGKGCYRYVNPDPDKEDYDLFSMGFHKRHIRCNLFQRRLFHELLAH